MSVNTQGAAPISVTVFGGLCTEQSAVDLPEGASPDCSDVEYLPGSVASRRGLQKVFATPFGTCTVTYAKSFVQPNGDIQNLYLDSVGNLWHEDVSNTPGSYTLLQAVQPGSYAKSITAFGREYIAISDGLHGSDMPLQWDGTNLDRVTQDGPGAPPTVANLALPSVNMAASGTAPTMTLALIAPDQKVNGYYVALNLYTGSSLAGIAIGQQVEISGTGGAFDGTFTVIANPGPGGALVVQAYYPGSTGQYVGGTLTIGTTGVTLTRNANVVTCQTTAAHNLKVGYQAQIAGGIPPLAVGGGISSIIINNEELPGLALVTMHSAHGLIPGNQVLIDSVEPEIAVVGVVSGSSQFSITWAGGIATVTCTVPHNLSPGALVTMNVGLSSGYAVTTPVLAVVSAFVFTFALTPLSTPAQYIAAGSDSINLSWPVPDTPNPEYFEVVACPSPTTFQIELEYADTTTTGFTGGQVAFPFEGTFFVASVPNATTFTYQHIGPNGTSNTVGTVTPYGQIAPGQRGVQVLFLTRQGYITRPSPPAIIQCNGGQYLQVTNIPTGPPNIVARIIALTGAGGAFYFYVPVPPQVNGQIVGTATQISDNTTTSVVLDVSDNTLFSAIGINVPGNTPANQIVIDGALGFGFYAGRLITWGQRNRVQNLQNMGFEGGAQPFGGSSGSQVPTPCGWGVDTAGGQIVPGHITGWGWKMGNGVGTIYQNAYEDWTGAPILQPNTLYAFRAWLSCSGNVTLTATISSPSTGFSSSAAISIPAASQYVQTAFSLATPSAIPSDMVLTISANAAVVIDELSLIYAEDPWLEGVLYGSYVDNPEAFDGVTGKFGASQDTHKVMDVGAIRQTLYLLTQDPGGRLHQTADNGTTEPAGWSVPQVAANCGLLSAFALTKSQADDASASAGEEWLAWLSSTGPRIFGGDFPYKIGQEIQPDFDAVATSVLGQGVGGAILTAGMTCWALNEISTKTLFFGVPITVSGTPGTYPNRVYACSYRELETAYQIGTSPAVHVAFTGRLVVSDHTRKWSRWLMTMNCAALMYRPDPAGGVGLKLQAVLFAGNGQNLAAQGFGNVYTLSPAKFTDDDFGALFPYSVTYFLPSHDQEQQLSYQLANGQRQPLGAGRKLLQYLSAFMATPSTWPNGFGLPNVAISFLVDSLSNVWPVSATRTLATAPKADLECGAGSAQGQRIAIKIAGMPPSQAAAPILPTDVGFVLTHLTVWLKSARVPVRGAV